MSVIESGTRKAANSAYIRPPTASYTRTVNGDLGIAKRAVGAFVFATDGTITLSGAFTPFELNDLILIQGTNLNNGQFAISVTGTNAITVFPPPKAETAPATAVLRLA
jgi:hypothetical protein